MMLIVWIIAEGQSDSIVQDIENMVRAYIEKVMYYFNFFLFCFGII